ncbi:hypothetical protein [Companilactobacillus alimentarius]|uniref:Uncharacterized protein n=1 Tax=Companilactobacillus alimentarius DSM 20249 TaxID=1423720 RepID=A0A2K9HMQ2_9LACO|nr:hypothetical protein [Companilactobacillus alimentarius]AUI71353.1 hypothetical protein LA20249_03700 [Companilactobacillus alimentarius DSM 20249]KRK74750.1 hypothetical protein FC67_GL002169 [Companilactobacillus alimentarius DSM 20249]MDT6951326.1 hypothetical protein [Companilactobacillus alimentarius]GEO44337.1 hypothetical protein LAL01_05690 [Companilactobacillus alimentarius]
MMMKFVLVVENSSERTYKVICDDDIGFVTVNKLDNNSISTRGNFSILFPIGFITNYVVRSLKYKNNPPKTMMYAAG